MVDMVKIENSMKDIYWYQARFSHPAMYPVDFDIWEKSFLHDIDGEGRTLFKELTAKGAYRENELVGFIQYGRTALGFDKDGKISESISYPIVRSLYFNRDLQEAGAVLLNEALKDFGNDSEIIYAFYHYFGMSCYARHGKLFESCSHISDLLLKLLLAHEFAGSDSKALKWIGKDAIGELETMVKAEGRGRLIQSKSHMGKEAARQENIQ